MKKLKPNLTPGARLEALGDGGWRLEMPAGPQGKYRLAQVDDYNDLPRGQFPWTAPFTMQLEARASAQEIAGTWGFGLWNNPFGLAIFTGVETLRLPALPDTAWFFTASPPNYLSLRDDLPAQGPLAATFRSPRLPSPLLLLGLPAAPLLLFRSGVRLLRKVGRGIVKQDAVQLPHDLTVWHSYRLDWLSDQVRMQVDDETVLLTPVTPQGRLGLVVWVDNQYAALSPNGRVGFGTLPTPEPAWIEIRNWTINGKEPQVDQGH